MSVRSQKTDTALSASPSCGRSSMVSSGRNGACLIGDCITVLDIAARVDVSGLHALRDRRAVRKYPAQDARDRADHGKPVHLADRLAGLNQRSNVPQLVEHTRVRRAQNTLSREAAN